MFQEKKGSITEVLMFKCKKCQSSDIKTRTNYTHGKKGSSTTNATCNNCGSTEMEIPQKGRKRN
jgi:transcription elongation factor Elf1